MKKIVLSAAACFLAIGCADPYAECELGPARDVVVGSIDAMGGLGRWQSIGLVEAVAVVSIYDDAGKAMINKHWHVIDMKKDVIMASARTAEGSWMTIVDGAGDSHFEPEGFFESLDGRDALFESLRTILHRVRGPINLCGEDEKPTGREKVRIDGQDLVRVSVAGGLAGVKAYYFDAQTCALRFVTEGADQAGENGTVTVYTWKMHPNGMAFPDKISVMKIGKNVLVGDTPVLEVDYRKVEW